MLAAPFPGDRNSHPSNLRRGVAAHLDLWVDGQRKDRAGADNLEGNGEILKNMVNGDEGRGRRRGAIEASVGRS